VDYSAEPTPFSSVRQYYNHTRSGSNPFEAVRPESFRPNHVVEGTLLKKEILH
jgi:hypothetical protein